MHFYAVDLKKYYYLGELMALVDLSLVSLRADIGIVVSAIVILGGCQAV